MDTPPAIIFHVDTIKTPNVVLTITPSGKIMRGDKELKDLSHDELLIVINELIDSIRKH